MVAGRRWLRDLCRAELPGFTEVMAYGIPGYGAADTVNRSLVERRYIVYLLRTDVRDAFASGFAEQDMGKGCLRFRSSVD